MWGKKLSNYLVRCFMRSLLLSKLFPHAKEQLSLQAAATEAVYLEPVLCNKGGCHREKPAHNNEE